MAKAKPASVAERTTRLLALLHRLSGDASKKDVHALRTTVRRLEVQLGAPPPKLAKALKKLRKSGGKVRDLDVHLGLLKAPLPLAHRKRRSAASQMSKPQDKLRKYLMRMRARRSDTLQDLVDDSLPLLESRLPAVAAEHVARAVSLHDARQRASRARRRYVQWTRHIPEDEQRLHELRIRTKRLRYELEPLAQREEIAELVQKFKQVQDAIGDWHDWMTLAELAADHFNSAKPSSAAGLFCEALRARAAREYRKARRSAETVRSWMTGSRPAAPAGADTGPRLVRKAG